MKKIMFAMMTVLFIVNGCDKNPDPVTLPTLIQSVEIIDGDVYYVIRYGDTRQVRRYIFDDNDVFDHREEMTVFLTVKDAQNAWSNFQSDLYAAGKQDLIVGMRVEDEILYVVYEREWDEEECGDLTAEELRAKIQYHIDNPKKPE